MTLAAIDLVDSLIGPPLRDILGAEASFIVALGVGSVIIAIGVAILMLSRSKRLWRIPGSIAVVAVAGNFFTAREAVGAPRLLFVVGTVSAAISVWLLATIPGVLVGRSSSSL